MKPKATPGRPLVTVICPAYRHERYVGRCVDTLLAQDYSPLQILICDDASPDRTFDVLSARVSAYRGPHDVKLLRNPRRLGIGTYNRLMQLARGDFIVVAQSDDWFVPHRVRRMVEAWQAHDACLVSSNALLVDEEDRESGLMIPSGTGQPPTLEALVSRGWTPTLNGSTLGWAPAVFTCFGPLDPHRSALTTDWIMPFRAALLGPLHYVDEPLVYRREHSGAFTQRLMYSDGSLASADARLAQIASQLMYMLGTLREWQHGQGAGQPELARIGRLLLGSLLTSVQRWTTVRQHLLAQGMRADWKKV